MYTPLLRYTSRFAAHKPAWTRPRTRQLRSSHRMLLVALPRSAARHKLKSSSWPSGVVTLAASEALYLASLSLVVAPNSTGSSGSSPKTKEVVGVLKSENSSRRISNPRMTSKLCLPIGLLFSAVRRFTPALIIIAITMMAHTMMRGTRNRRKKPYNGPWQNFSSPRTCGSPAFGSSPTQPLQKAWLKTFTQPQQQPGPQHVPGSFELLM
mmetsp:Transcript_102610/g.295494  ORF Transcript_102610/g.295494 Transcript_102610/m.295494 type:complete len:210 (+) Transcript_102610:135-764(+)